MITDSGERIEYPNGFVRDMGEMKGRTDLLPWKALRRVSIHCEEGAKKYGERNIDKGAPKWSLHSSGLRHWSKVIEPEPNDEEDRITHMTAAVWNGLWALERMLKEDDIKNGRALPDELKAMKPAVERNNALREEAWEVLHKANQRKLMEEEENE